MVWHNDELHCSGHWTARCERHAGGSLPALWLAGVYEDSRKRRGRDPWEVEISCKVTGYCGISFLDCMHVPLIYKWIIQSYPLWTGFHSEKVLFWKTIRLTNTTTYLCTFPPFLRLMASAWVIVTGFVSPARPIRRLDEPGWIIRIMICLRFESSGSADCHFVWAISS